MTLADKLKAMWTDNEVWSDEYETMYGECVDNAALCLYDCSVSHYKPFPQQWFQCESVFLLLDGSWILFKTVSDITTCTELTEQGFVMHSIELNDGQPSYISVENIRKLINPTT